MKLGSCASTQTLLLPNAAAYVNRSGAIRPAGSRRRRTAPPLCAATLAVHDHICFTDAMQKILVIVNPASDGGATARFWPRARKHVHAASLEFQEVYTEGPGHARALARQAGELGTKVIMYVGGDGTANEVINGMMDVPTSARPVLACLPRGTGADLPKSLGLAGGPQAALRRILVRREKLIDLAAGHFLSLDGTEERRFFVNIADAGIGGYVAERVNRSSKRLGGFLSFLGSTLTTFWDFQKPYLRVSVDGQEVHSGPTTSVAIANGSRFGGGMLMAPEALLDDALLDIVIIKDLSKGELVLNLPRLYRGTHLSHPKVDFHQGREVEVTCDKSVPLDIDGEHPGTTPFHVWIEPSAVRVLV